jgi:hypothetical protein
MSAVNRTATATIALGASLSGGIYLGAGQLCGLVLPTGWDTASITFQSSMDGTIWLDFYDDGGNEVVLTPATAKYTPLDAGTFGGVVYLKVRSGTAGSPVNQSAARAIVTSNRILGRDG